jgi:3-dehydroquinate dehydratase-1
MRPLTIKHTTFGEGTPKICIPIIGRRAEDILEAAETITTLPADVVEWRADHYEAVAEPGAVPPVLDALRKKLPDTLLLFTFRTKKEGGVRELSDSDYLELCRAVAKSGLADLLDLELFTGALAPEPDGQATTGGQAAADRRARPVANPGLLAPVITLAHAHGGHVVLSSHDFQKTPSENELYRRLFLMESMGADLAKLAVMPNCEQDVLTLLSATRKAADALNVPVITMSMGRIGAVSRISGRLTGSCMTFGTAGEESAPGQLPAKTLKHILETL